jgi:hypothetical protein
MVTCFSGQKRQSAYGGTTFCWIDTSKQDSINVRTVIFVPPAASRGRGSCALLLYSIACLFKPERARCLAAASQ